MWGRGVRKETWEQGLKQWKTEIIIMGARELHGHIKAESPGVVVKCSIKNEFSGNIPWEPWPKPLTISGWKALNLQKTSLLSILFREVLVCQKRWAMLPANTIWGTGREIRTLQRENSSRGSVLHVCHLLFSCEDADCSYSLVTCALHYWVVSHWHQITGATI